MFFFFFPSSSCFLLLLQPHLYILFSSALVIIISLSFGSDRFLYGVNFIFPHSRLARRRRRRSFSLCSLFALKADGQVQINRINQWEIRGQSAGNELRLQQISSRDYSTVIVEKDAAGNARDRAELTIDNYR